MSISFFRSSFSQISFKILFFCLLAKFIVMAIYILSGLIELSPDEAQYWTWSQALDWGYYSKPPAIAWQIWLGTILLGQNELGVRFFSLVFSFFQGLGIYYLAISAKLDARIAVGAALLMAFSPIGILGSVLAITDTGLLLCWIGACWSVVSALSNNKEPDPIETALWIVAGALFKWPMYSFWLFYLVSWPLFFPKQKLTLLLKGFLVSLIGLLPSLYWNISHDYATFKHVFATLQGGSVQKVGGNFLEFFGSQVALLSPVIFLLFCFTALKWFQERKCLPPQIWFCGFISLSLFSFASILALFQKVQGNWIVYAYPTAFVLMGWYLSIYTAKFSAWMLSTIGTSLMLVAGLLSLPLFYAYSETFPFKMNYKNNPFKHQSGFAALSQVLEEIGYDPNEHFLVSDKYQTSSLLSFYTTGKKRAYFLNLQGSRKNQFSYWPSLKSEGVGKTGFFIWVENSPYLGLEKENKHAFYSNKLSEYFDLVEYVGFIPLVYHRNTVAKAALVFRCKECKQEVDENNIFY